MGARVPEWTNPPAPYEGVKAAVHLRPDSYYYGVKGVRPFGAVISVRSVAVHPKERTLKYRRDNDE